MNNVSFTIEPSDLLDPPPSFRHRDRRGAVQVKFEFVGPANIWTYVTAAEAREVAAAFTRLAVEIEAEDARLAAGGVGVDEMARHIEDQLANLSHARGYARLIERRYSSGESFWTVECQDCGVVLDSGHPVKNLEHARNLLAKHNAEAHEPALMPESVS